MRCLSWIILLCSALFAQESTRLHIDTWPSNAEVNLSIPPAAKDLHSSLTPYVQTLVMDSSTIRLYFFKPGYHDTSITIRLKPNPENYVFFHLQPESDSLQLDLQNQFLRERSAKLWAQRTWISASLPAALTLLFLSQTAYAYHRAANDKEKAANSTFTGDQAYNTFVQEYQRHALEGNDAKHRAWIAAGATGLFLAAGCLINF